MTFRNQVSYWPIQSSFAAFWFFFSVLTSTAQLPCNPQILKDSTLLFSLGAINDNSADCRACLRTTSPPVLVLFKNGTQVSELTPQETERFLAKNPAFQVSPTVEKKSRRDSLNWAGKLWGDSSFASTILKPDVSIIGKLSKTLTLGAWPTGFTLTDNLGCGASTRLVFNNTFRMEYLGSLFEVYAGVGYERKSLFGILPSELFGDSLNRHINGSWSWTVGLPFIRYEMKQAGYIIPDYFWLEDNINNVLHSSHHGSFLKSMDWRWDSKHKDNMSHAIYIKAGYFHLDFFFDGDVYHKSVTRMSFEQLPSFFGTWGISLTKAPDVWIPGGWLQTPQLNTPLFRFSDYEIPIAFSPVRFSFNYWSLRRYQVSAQTVLTFDIKEQ